VDHQLTQLTLKIPADKDQNVDPLNQAANMMCPWSEFTGIIEVLLLLLLLYHSFNSQVQGHHGKLVQEC